MFFNFILGFFTFFFNLSFFFFNEEFLISLSLCFFFFFIYIFFKKLFRFFIFFRIGLFYFYFYLLFNNLRLLNEKLFLFLQHYYSRIVFLYQLYTIFMLSFYFETLFLLIKSKTILNFLTFFSEIFTSFFFTSKVELIKKEIANYPNKFKKEKLLALDLKRMYSLKKAADDSIFFDHKAGEYKLYSDNEHVINNSTYHFDPSLVNTILGPNLTTKNIYGFFFLRGLTEPFFFIGPDEEDDYDSEFLGGRDFYPYPLSEEEEGEEEEEEEGKFEDEWTDHSFYEKGFKVWNREEYEKKIRKEYEERLKRESEEKAVEQKGDATNKVAENFAESLSVDGIYEGKKSIGFEEKWKEMIAKSFIEKSFIKKSVKKRHKVFSDFWEGTIEERFARFLIEDTFFWDYQNLVFFSNLNIDDDVFTIDKTIVSIEHSCISFFRHFHKDIYKEYYNLFCDGVPAYTRGFFSESDEIFQDELRFFSFNWDWYNWPLFFYYNQQKTKYLLWISSISIEDFISFSGCCFFFDLFKKAF